MENIEFNASQLPFNQLIHLKDSDKAGYILMLDDSPDYHNHLQTVHASALFALAEATSGQFLINEFNNQATAILPVVRQATVKYKKGVTGCVYSTAAFDGF